jgi:methylmalonyl-CoA mutase
MTLADTISLADRFPAPSHEAWIALVEKTLKGGSADNLRSTTRDGLTVEGLYHDGPKSPVRPGLRDPVRPWDIRTNVRHPDPARANADALADLEGGAASVLIKIDPKGQSGVAIGSQDGLARVLDGVMLDLAPVALNAGFHGPEAAEWLAALAKGAPEAELYLHLDPITQFAQKGSSPGPIESHILHAATTAVRLGRTYPKAGLFLASGRIAHEAGGTEAQELAFCLASGLAYVKALVRAGATIDEAFAGTVLGLSATSEYFNTVAKLRAARLLWAKIAAACGADAARPARIETRSSFRMLSKLDAWTNLLRLASACFGAGVGGADAVVLAPFTEALGLPSALARRQARNIQLVLMEESHIGAVADPAGGAWFLETLTHEMARAAWSRFQAIEAKGGIIAALEAGSIQADIAQAADAQAAQVAQGKQQILGVTKFRNADLSALEVETVDGAQFTVTTGDSRKPGPDSGAKALTPHRLAEQFEVAQ